MTVGEFLAWWRGELAGMLPGGLRRRLAGRRQTLRLTPAGDTLRIARRDGDREELLATVDLASPDAGARVTAALHGYDPASTRIQVAVPEEKVLIKQVQMPLAAEENLREVLGFEMQRQTPFRAEQVLYNFRVLARRPGSQQLDVEMSVVPRAVVESVLGPLKSWGLIHAPDQGRSGDEGQNGGVFAFVADSSGQTRAGRLRRLLVAANAVLLVTVIAVPFVQQREYLDELRTRLEAARAAAATAGELQQRIDDHRARARYLFARKTGSPAVVELMEELSRRLPDDTWLFRAELRDGTVHLQGTSGRASALIAGLEDSRLLENVRFASPVTQDGASGRERFHVSATVAAPRPATFTGHAEGRDS